MRGFVVTLSNGKTIREDSIMSDLSDFVIANNLQNSSHWIILKKYIQSNNLKVFGLQLQFDHQGVFLPNHAKVYFYSRKVEAYIGARTDQSWYYGVGASDRFPDEVEITWYDGNNSKIEKRKVNAEDPAFIIN